jgi:hypothetical protein
VWSQFHQLRLSTLPQLWNDFLKAEDLPHVNPLLLQSNIFWSPCSLNMMKCSTTRQSTVILKEKANAMRYACGFVPYRLLRNYEKNSDKKSISVC